MADDLERLNRLLDDLAAERNPADRAALTADEVELAEMAAFLKAASAERSAPDEAFVERLGAQLAASTSAETASVTPPAASGVSRRRLLGRIAAAAAGLAVGAGGGEALRGRVDQAAADQQIAQERATAARQIAQERATAYDKGKRDGAKHADEAKYSDPLITPDRGEWMSTNLKVADIPLGSAIRFRAGAVEGFLVNPSNGGAVYAVSAACTHMGCMLSWLVTTGTFLCPCHGAQYNADGSTLSGIARHPLPHLAIQTEQDGSISVWAVAEFPVITSVAPYKGF